MVSTECELVSGVCCFTQLCNNHPKFIIITLRSATAWTATRFRSPGSADLWLWGGGAMGAIHPRAGERSTDSGVARRWCRGFRQ